MNWPVVKSWGIVRPKHLVQTQSKRLSTGEELGLLADVAGAVGLDGVEIHEELLKSGHRQSPAHRHTRRIEIVYVLEGAPTVRLDGRDKILRSGEFVVFRPEEKKYHNIRNDTDHSCRLIVISFNGENDSVLYEPEQYNLFEDE